MLRVCKKLHQPRHVTRVPFGLTRTHPCPTFDICGHVWAESFHYFDHYEGQWAAFTL